MSVWVDTGAAVSKHSKSDQKGKGSALNGLFAPSRTFYSGFMASSDVITEKRENPKYNSKMLLLSSIVLLHSFIFAPPHLQ